MARIEELAEYGQSVWLDDLRRSLIMSGELQSLIQMGISGLNENLHTFEAVILESSDYDEAILKLAREGKAPEQIYEQIEMEDVRKAADLLLPVYERSGGGDGFVSVTISPKLSYAIEDALAEAWLLFATLERPNVMIKIPATLPGVKAVQRLIGQGVNVHASLISSVDQYRSVVQAYVTGLRKLAAEGGDLSKVFSVASILISPVDALVDPLLENLTLRGGLNGAALLMGKIAIANAKMAYGIFRDIFESPDWKSLEEQGAHVQRIHWADTKVRNPYYPDTHYVDNLIGPGTIAGMGMSTLRAFLDHGRPSFSLDWGVEIAKVQLDRLSELAIDLNALTQKLHADALGELTKSANTLVDNIAEKYDRLVIARKDE
jgi:transaldolase